MALKTVIKLLLSKYGILSVDMQTAITVDQSIIKDAETMDVEYVDANEREKQSSTAFEDKEMDKIEITETQDFSKLKADAKGQMKIQ
jgi:recombination protein RecT